MTVEKPGKWIARGMSRLANRKGEVRVLVYGQSISQQDWWKQARDSLRERFPGAKLVMESRAIGGFHSTRLVKCAEQDAILFAPDLILFHDYGPEDDYEQIIRTLRDVTWAEIAVMSDHVHLDGDQGWHDRHSFEWLPDLCRRYHMELIDVRGRWKEHLAQNTLQPQDLLSDTVHLNEAGNRLMASIVGEALVYHPEHGDDPQGIEQTLVAGRDFTPGSRIIAEVEALRIDLALTERVTMNIRVDAMRPSAQPWTFIAESPWISAPNARPERVGMPLRVDLRAGPIPDDWQMWVKEVIDDGAEVRFSLFSGHSGFEGKGTSAADFFSESGRVILRAGNWFTRETPQFFEGVEAVRPGDIIRFEVARLSCDEINPMGQGLFNIINHLPAGKHRLGLYNVENRFLPVESIKIFHRFRQ